MSFEISGEAGLPQKAGSAASCMAESRRFWEPKQVGTVIRWASCDSLQTVIGGCLAQRVSGTGVQQSSIQHAWYIAVWG